METNITPEEEDALIEEDRINDFVRNTRITLNFDQKLTVEELAYMVLDNFGDNGYQILDFIQYILYTSNLNEVRMSKLVRYKDNGPTDKSN